MASPRLVDQMAQEMVSEMRDLLGGGLVDDYYEDMAQPFISIAEHYMELAEEVED